MGYWGWTYRSTFRRFDDMLLSDIMELYPNKYGLKSDTGTGESFGKDVSKRKIDESCGLFEKLHERLELVYILMTGGDVNRVHGSSFIFLCLCPNL